MRIAQLDAAGQRSLVAAGVLAAALAWPAQHAADGPVVCPFRLVTGLPCPVCGMTRSFVYTVHGRLGQAFAAHPLGPLLVLVAAAWVVTGRRHAGTWLDPRRWAAGRGRRWLLAVGAAWLVFGFVRMGVVATGWPATPGALTP